MPSAVPLLRGVRAGRSVAASPVPRANVGARRAPPALAFAPGFVSAVRRAARGASFGPPAAEAARAPPPAAPAGLPSGLTGALRTGLRATALPDRTGARSAEAGRGCLAVNFARIKTLELGSHRDRTQQFGFDLDLTPV